MKKHHHTVVTVLLGWTLILPPLVRNQVDAGAPTSEWKVQRRGFATVHDCEEFRAHGHLTLNLDIHYWDPKADPARSLNSRAPRAAVSRTQTRHKGFASAYPLLTSRSE